MVDVEGFCCEGRGLAVANVGGIGNWKLQSYSGFELQCLDTNGRLYKGLGIRLVSLRICSRPQQTLLFSSYTVARKFLSGLEEGIRALTLYIGQVGKIELTGPRWSVAAAVL